MYIWWLLKFVGVFFCGGVFLWKVAILWQVLTTKNPKITSINNKNNNILTSINNKNPKITSMASINNKNPKIPKLQVLTTKTTKF